MKKFLKKWLVTGAGVILGLIFVVAGFGKIFTGSEGLRRIFNPFPGFLTPALTDSIFIWLPYLEILIGLLLIIGVVPRLAGVISIVLVAGFITNNAWVLGQGLGFEPCSCFGFWDRIVGIKVSTTQSLYIDIAMLVLGLVVIIGTPGHFLKTRPWFLTKRDT